MVSALKKKKKGKEKEKKKQLREELQVVVVQEKLGAKGRQPQAFTAKAAVSQTSGAGLTRQ